MADTFELDADQFDELMQAMQDYGDGALEKVSETLRESGEDIYQRINELIHPSGRKWKGKAGAANVSYWPLIKQDDALSVTVTTKSRYSYLYFPDDGTNTKNHAGMQEFFRRGGESAIPNVIEKCQQALIERWEQ